MSFDDPFALAKCWRNYFNNQILEIAQNLWKEYHFIGSTDRISTFGPRPYANALVHLWIADHPNPRTILSQEKLQSLSHFYIADYVINMLSIMSMHVMMILHGILMMVIHLMLLPPIDE